MNLSPAKSGIAKMFYLSFGIIFLIIGLIGLLLPILPGWLFLIPAVLCFAKSSQGFNNWLRKRKSFSKYFSDSR
jgi:hypothetical protein